MYGRDCLVKCLKLHKGNEQFFSNYYEMKYAYEISLLCICGSIEHISSTVYIRQKNLLLNDRPIFNAPYMITHFIIKQSFTLEIICLDYKNEYEEN